MRASDVLLHHPFESFAPVLELVRQAAADPHVLAIKQTLYRTGADSPIVDALVDAARAARKSRRSSSCARASTRRPTSTSPTRLQEAGAQVVYGVVGYKTHAKMLLVVRREGGRLAPLLHLGTGNYHPSTARAYTDFGLFTCDERIGEDVHELFLQLTGLAQTPQLRKLLQSPFTLHERLLGDRARGRAARAGRQPARIIAKMNALIEPQIIAGALPTPRAPACRST